MNILYQGAEAVLKFDGNHVIKERISKGYRIKELDYFLRRKRTTIETSLMRMAARNGIAVPSIIEEGNFTISMQYINGIKVRDMKDWSIIEIADAIGENVKKLHEAGIIHGDLTTSNMIFCEKRIYFIDFGLGFFSNKTEDRATDIRLFRQAIESTHFSASDAIWEHFSNAYGNKEVIKRLYEIEKRGRYRKKKEINS